MKKTLLILLTHFLVLACRAQNDSWLVNASEKNINPSIVTVDTLLRQMNGNMRLVLCKYNDNKLVRKTHLQVIF
jgi:uncharacterized protein YcfL